MKNLKCISTSLFLFLFLSNLMAQVPDTILARVYLDSAKVLIGARQFDDGLIYGEKAIMIYKNYHGQSDPLIAEKYTAIANKLELNFSFPEALRYYNKSLNIYKEYPNDLKPKISMIYDRLGVVHGKLSELDEAENNFNKALEIGLESIGKFDPQVATIYSNLAIVYQAKGKHDKALLARKTVLEIRLKVLDKNNPEIASSYNGIAIIYKLKGDFKKTLDYLEKGKQVFFESQNENHPGLAYIYNNIGGVYEDKGEYDKTLKFRKKALNIDLKLLDKHDPQLARSLSNVGTAYIFMNNFDKASEYFKNALEIQFQAYGLSHPDIARSYNHLGMIYKEKGEFYKALNYYQKSIQIFLNFLEETHPLVAGSYSNLAIIYNNIEEHDKALNYANKALDIRLKVFKENHQSVALSYLNIGVIYFNKKDYTEALNQYEKALKINLSNFGEMNPQVAAVYENIGNVYIRMNEKNKALEYHKKALKIRINTLNETHLGVARSYNNLGNTNYKLGNFQKAIECYGKGKKIKIAILGNNHPDLVEINYYLSKVYLALDEHETSFDYLQEAININETIKRTYSSSKQLNLSKNIPLYESTISAQLDRSASGSIQGDLKETFNYSEKVKSNLLLEALNTSYAKSFSDIPDSLLNQEYQIRTDITFREKQRQKKLSQGLSETDSTVLAISSKLFDLNQGYESLISQLEKNYPKYYQAKYDFSTMEVGDVQQQLLTDNQSLIEYFVGDSSIFVFLVQKDNFEVHEIKKDFPLEEWVQEMTKEGIYGYYTLSRAERNATLQDNTIINYTNAAQGLYEKLLAPFEDKLTKDLIIIPDGVLGYVPFEALLTAAPPREGAFRAYPYLIKKYQISYCYSATLLQEMKQKQHQQTPTESLLAMAPFYQGDVHEMVARIDTSELLALRDSLAALPASGEEVAAIVKILDGTPSYGSAASLQQFEQLAANYRILHLSTHGKADDRVGDYAYLAFGVPDEAGTFDRLYARDLYNYSLNADMVVLSACETGIGKLQRGEGIISLARAFAYAGAKSIFTTLWQVSDEKTKDLMVYFYKNLKKGETKDEALRNAKLEYLEKNNGEALHPFFWAGLIGIGDMSPVAQ